MDWRRILIAAAVVATAHASGADEQDYYDEKARGWFWYAEPPPTLKTTEPLPPEPSALVPAEPSSVPPAPFTTAWIRARMPEVIDAAIDDPGNEAKVKQAAWMTRLMLDKASDFVAHYKQAVMTDPLLDETNRVPMSAVGRTHYLRQQARLREEALAAVAARAGIWFFYDERCTYCIAQAPIIDELALKHDFVLMPIAVGGGRDPLPGLGHRPVWMDQGHAKRFRIEVTPAVVLASPPDQYVVLTQGLLALNDLESRLLIGADHLKLIPEPLIDAVDPGRSSRLPARLATELSGDVLNDPEQFVDYIETTLKGTPQ